MNPLEERVQQGISFLVTQRGKVSCVVADLCRTIPATASASSSCASSFFRDAIGKHADNVKRDFKLWRSLLDREKNEGFYSTTRPATSSVTGESRLLSSSSLPPASSTQQPGSQRSGSSVFDIGTVDVPLLPIDEEREAEGRTQFSDVPFNSNFSQEYVTGTRPTVDIEDVRQWVRSAVYFWSKLRRLGFTETSWKNKMPWLHPRAPFLAKGLHWPPEQFNSEEAKLQFYKKARKRERYFMQPLPTWTFMIPNFFLLAFLINVPEGRHFSF